MLGDAKEEFIEGYGRVILYSEVVAIHEDMMLSPKSALNQNKKLLIPLMDRTLSATSLNLTES